MILTGGFDGFDVLTAGFDGFDVLTAGFDDFDRRLHSVTLNGFV